MLETVYVSDKFEMLVTDLRCEIAKLWLRKIIIIAFYRDNNSDKAKLGLFYKYAFGIDHIYRQYEHVLDVEDQRFHNPLEW